MIFYICISFLILILGFYCFIYYEMRAIRLGRDSKGMYTFTKFLNTYSIDPLSYSVIQDSIGGNNLFIGTHDYNALDALPLINLFRMDQNHLYYIIRNYDITNHIADWIFTPMLDNIKNITTETGIVNKAIKLLNNGDNIILFLHKHRKVTGGFHIANNSDCNIILIRIRCTDSSEAGTYVTNLFQLNKLLSYINKHFILECKRIRLDTDDPEHFIESVKQWLYE